MYYLLPSEVLAMQRAGIALREARERFRVVSYASNVSPQTEDPAMGVKALLDEVRRNTTLLEASTRAESALYSLIITAKIYDCPAAEAAHMDWYTEDWVGPEFSVKR